MIFCYLVCFTMYFTHIKHIMLIQWYPGHMHKASKEVKLLMPQVDLIIEVIDARIPFSSQNPMIAKLRGDKPTIKILSKSDLADPDMTQLWQNYLEQEQGVKTLAVTSKNPEKIRQLLIYVTSCFLIKRKTVN